MKKPKKVKISTSKYFKFLKLEVPKVKISKDKKIPNSKN
jgi:hypothetical protein